MTRSKFYLSSSFSYMKLIGTTTRCGLESNGAPDYTTWRYTMEPRWLIYPILSYPWANKLRGVFQIKSKRDGKKIRLDHSLCLIFVFKQSSLTRYSLLALVTPSSSLALLIWVCRLWFALSFSFLHYRLSFQATSRHLSPETPYSFMKQLRRKVKTNDHSHHIILKSFVSNYLHSSISALI